MPERKWQPNLIENGPLVSKNPKDGKCDSLKSFKNQKLEKSLQNGVRELFSKEKHFEGVARGSKSGHAHLPVEWAQGVSSEIGYGCRLI